MAPRALLSYRPSAGAVLVVREKGDHGDCAREKSDHSDCVREMSDHGDCARERRDHGDCAREMSNRGDCAREKRRPCTLRMKVQVAPAC